MTAQVDDGVKHNVLRRLFTPYSQHRPLYTGLSSTETGIELNGNYREVSSITDHQSNPQQFTKDNFSYNQNIPDDRHSRPGVTGVRSELSSIFPSHSQHRGQGFERRQSRVNYHPRSQEAAKSGNSYYTPSVIIRKSSHKEAERRPFHQGFHPSQVWDPEDAQKSYNEEKVQGNDSPNVWQPSDSSRFSSQTGRYWGTSLPTSKGHYSGYKDTNELVAVGPWSTPRAIQSSKFFGLASQTAHHGPSVRNSLDVPVAKSNPSPEKLASSITDFSPRLHSSETPRYKKVQSHLFKNSQTPSVGRETVNPATADGHSAFSTTAQKQRLSDAQIYGRLSSEPRKEVQHLVRFHQANFNHANPLYHNANVAQYGAQMNSFTKYQHSTTAETQMSAYPAPGIKGDDATGSKKSVANSLVNTTARGSVHASEPGRTTKSIYGFRGFRNPMWRAVKEPFNLSSSGSNERNNSGRHSFHKGRFKIANVYPSFSPKYSFGQRDASTTPTNYSSPSPGTLDIIQTTTTPRPLFPLGFKEAQPLLPESDAGVDSNPDGRRFKIYRIYGLKGFGARPLEGAKPLIKEPDQSARVQRGFEGFKLRSSQIWQPESSGIHRWYNKTEPGSSHVSTISEPSSKDLKQLLKTAGSTEADKRFTPDRYKKNHKIYTHLGYHPVQRRMGNGTSKTHWEHKAPASASPRISSASPRSAGELKVVPSPKSEPRPPNRTKPLTVTAHLLNSPTRSVVRGQRVGGKNTTGKKLNESTSLTSDGNVAIVRLPRLKAVTYTDILGSASFSGVRATIQTPITPPDKDYFPTATIKQKEVAGNWTLDSEDAVQSRDNLSRGPKANAEGDGGFRGEDVDSDINTSDLFLDNEGSGSGGFNMSDIFSSRTPSQRLGGDLLELDYLRISAGNISFKSMKQSHTEK